MIIELAVDNWVKVKFKSSGDYGYSFSIGKFKEGQLAYAKRNVELPSAFSTWWITDPDTKYLLNVDEEIMKSSVYSVRDGGQPIVADHKIQKKIAAYFLNSINLAKKARAIQKPAVKKSVPKSKTVLRKLALKKIPVKKRRP